MRLQLSEQMRKAEWSFPFLQGHTGMVTAGAEQGQQSWGGAGAAAGI